MWATSLAIHSEHVESSPQYHLTCSFSTWTGMAKDSQDSVKTIFPINCCHLISFVGSHVIAFWYFLFKNLDQNCQWTLLQRNSHFNPPKLTFQSSKLLLHLQALSFLLEYSTNSLQNYLLGFPPTGFHNNINALK